MNLKIELIALAVRLASEKTNLVRKPDVFESFITEMFGGESYDRHVARTIAVEAERGIAAAKRVNINRKFKKIIQHV